MKKNSRNTKYLNVFLGVVGGGIVFYILFILGYNILLGIIYKVLEAEVETPKICTSNGLSQTTKQTTIPTQIMNNPQTSEQTEHIGGSVQSIFVTDTYVYASIGLEIAILDFTDITHPR